MREKDVVGIVTFDLIGFNTSHQETNCIIILHYGIPEFMRKRSMLTFKNVNIDRFLKNSTKQRLIVDTLLSETRVY